MILTCPACGTRYRAAPASFGPTGRRVRCAKCSYSWVQTPPAEMPKRREVEPPHSFDDLLTAAAPPSPALSVPALDRIYGPSPTIAPPPASSRAAPRDRFGLAMLAAVLLVLLGSLFYFGRERLALAFPGLHGVYATLGIAADVPGAGLELSNVTFAQREVGGRDVVVIQGEIFNGTEEPKPIPSLKAVFRDAAHETLEAWTFRIDQPQLEPGETATFTNVSESMPPPSSTRLSISFTDETADSLAQAHGS